MRRLFAAAFAVWSLIASISAAAVVGITMVLPFAPVPRGRRERYTMIGAEWWAWFVVHVILLTKVRIRQPMPEVGGAILLCNHRSWLDPLMLMAWGRSNGLSKREILYIPAVGFFGWLAGGVFFDRRSPSGRSRARDDVMLLVRNGHRIQVFPEGTRTKDGRLREKVYLTLARDAWEAGVPVVPCAVAHTERVLPVGKLAAYPLQPVDLIFGEVMRPADHASGDAFAEQAWERVRALVASLD